MWSLRMMTQICQIWAAARTPQPLAVIKLLSILSMGHVARAPGYVPMPQGWLGLQLGWWQMRLKDPDLSCSFLPVQARHHHQWHLTMTWTLPWKRSWKSLPLTLPKLDLSQPLWQPIQLRLLWQLLLRRCHQASHLMQGPTCALFMVSLAVTWQPP